MESLAIACTLTPRQAQQRLERWRIFDADYALEVERGPGFLAVSYAKNEDSLLRLRELVAAEQTCCPFFDWRIDEQPHRLRLTVQGDDDQLATLNLG
jgi:hypothetical protein